MQAPSPPRWARYLDFLCVVLVVFAVVLSLFGGIRTRLAGFRIQLTSPYRVLLWAIAVGVVRHALVRRPPIYRDLPLRLVAGWRTAAWRAVAAVMAGTRLPILFVGYFAVFMIGFPATTGAPWKIDPNEFVNLQARADTGWYMNIAVDGYSYVPRRPDVQQNIVFFPAFPLLLRLTGRLFGGSPMAFMFGGTLIVLAVFAGALVYLYRLARDLLGDDAAARHTLWLLAAYPFALFYSALYTESLYLLAAVGAFVHFRNREWLQAGVWGLLAGLTRPNGCFLSVPLAVLAVSPHLPASLAGEKAVAGASTGRDFRSLVPAIASAAMPGIGMLIYSAFIWQLTGNPLEWAEGHLAWGRQYSGVGTLVSEQFAFMSQVGLYEYTARLPYDVLNGLGVVFVACSIVPVARRFGAAYALFVLINILPPLAAGGLMSAGRFSAVLFPVFIWFAAAVPDRHRPAWLAGFMALQALNAALFYTWRPLV
jgi:hypothetical protein